MKLLNDVGLKYLIDRMKEMIDGKADIGYVDSVVSDNFLRLRQEYFVTKKNQEVFNLTEGSYIPHSNSISWYLDGIKQPNSGIEEISPTAVRIKGMAPLDSTVIIEYFEFKNIQMVQMETMSRKQIISVLGHEVFQSESSPVEPKLKIGDEWHKEY